MKFVVEHKWRKLITHRLSPELESHFIASDNKEFELIETEIAKLGTISHDTVDIPNLQQLILKLLSTETKDFRLLAHLTYTLQRGGQFEQIILAVALLADFIELYWDIAAPQQLKNKIVKLIVQRFSTIKNKTHNHNLTEERYEFMRLKRLLTKSYPDLTQEIDKLTLSNNLLSLNEDNHNHNTSNKYDNNKASLYPSSHLKDTTLSIAESYVSVAKQSDTFKIALDNSSDDAWRKTLLKIVTIEESKSIHQPIVFQLRRHVVWLNIAYPADNNGITVVPPVPIEKINEYELGLNKPDLNLWQKIEKTISYSPYWFDGHYMSARIAEILGYSLIAKVIKNELRYFLELFPKCKNLCYSNGDPFASDATLKWLENSANSNISSAEYAQALTLYQENGIEQALNYLEQISTTEPRSLFHSQILAVKLLCEMGCFKLAKQQLDNLQTKAINLNVLDWEPSFFELCNNLQEQISSKG